MLPKQLKINLDSKYGNIIRAIGVTAAHSISKTRGNPYLTTNTITTYAGKKYTKSSFIV